MRYRLLFFLVFTSALLLAQEVTTLVPPATIHSFEAISWGKDGRIYSPDFGGGHIHRINLDGTVTRIATGYLGPLGGVFTDDGMYYVSEYGTGKIFRISPSGQDSLMATGFGGPTGMLVDSAQTKIFIADYNNSRVNVLDLETGESSVLAARSGLNGPDGIVFAPNGDLIVANFNDNKIHRVTMDGEVSLFATLTGSPNSGYLVNFGNAYICAGANGNRIYHVTQDGEASVWAGTGVAGENNGAADQATFLMPNGIAINPTADTLLVTSGERGIGMRMITNLGFPTAVAENLVESFQFQLSPNPVRSQLKVSYELPQSAAVKLALHAPSGQLLKTMVDSTQVQGLQERVYQLDDHLPAGHYRLVLTVNGRSATKPLVLVR